MSKTSKPAKPIMSAYLTPGTPRQAPPPPAKPADACDALILALVGVVNGPHVRAVQRLGVCRTSDISVNITLEMHERDAQ